MDRKRGTDKIVDFEDNYYSIGGSGLDTLISGADKNIFINNQRNNKFYFNTFKDDDSKRLPRYLLVII